MEAARSLLRPESDSPSELSLVGGTSGRHGLTIENYQNSELADSGNTGPLIEIRLLEEGGKGTCGAAVAGRARFFISYMYESSTDSHTRSRGSRDELPEGKGGAWVVLSPLALQQPSSAFYQLALSRSTASRINNFEGLPLPSYTLEIRGKIFQVVEAEAQQTSMLFPEGIRRAKGEDIKADKPFIPLIEASPEYLSINKEGTNMEWLRKWHHRDIQEKGQPRKDQEFIMGDIIEIQASIVGGRERFRRRRSDHNHLGRYLSC